MSDIDGRGINYWKIATNKGATKSPYLSDLVQDGPQLPDIIRLQPPTTITVDFGAPVTDMFMGFVSLNKGQQYNFSTDFEILSQATGPENSGFWGYGLAEKNVYGDVYQMAEVSGEPHGMLYFEVYL